MFITDFRKFLPTRLRIGAYLLVAAFLALEVTVLTHEISHDLHQHDDPSCVLHLCAEHLAKTSVASPSIALVIAHGDVHAPLSFVSVVPAPTSSYRSRAPPHSSESPIV